MRQKLPKSPKKKVVVATKMVMLEKGQSAGSVSESVEKKLVLQAAGHCASPNCRVRLFDDGSHHSKVAHIIPRKVGGPREDWTTPLADRNKLENLILLCGQCHDKIDDLSQVDRFQKALLEDWKRQHDEWVESLNKATGGNEAWAEISARFEHALSDIDSLIELFGNVESLLERGAYESASVIISSIEDIALQSKKSYISERFLILKARWLAGTNKSKDAEALLRGILAKNQYQTDAEIALGNILLQSNDGLDEATRIRNKLKSVIKSESVEFASFIIFDLNWLLYTRGDFTPLSGEILAKIPDLKAALIFLRYSQLSHNNNHIEEREKWFGQYDAKAPNSPNTILVRMQYLILDAQRNHEDYSQKDYIDLNQNIKSLETKLATKRSPLTLNEQINLNFYKIESHSLLTRFQKLNMDELDNTFKTLISLLIQVEMDAYAAHILKSLFSTIHILQPHNFKSIDKYLFDNKKNIDSELMKYVLPAIIRHRKTSLFTSLENINSFIYRDLIQAINNEDAEQLVNLIEDMPEQHISGVLESLSDEFELKVLELLSSKYPDNLYYKLLKLVLCNKLDLPDDALKLAKNIDVENQTYPILKGIAQAAAKAEVWELEVRALKKLLAFALEDDEKAYYITRLLLAYRSLEDTSEVIKTATTAVTELKEHISSNNQIIACHYLAEAYDQRGEFSELVKFHKDNPSIEFEPATQILISKAYIETGDFDESLSVILKCLAGIKPQPLPEHFIGCFEILMNLRALQPSLFSKPDKVKSGTFVKISDIASWFCLGKGETLDAVQLAESDGRFKVLENKLEGEEIDWPADKHSNGLRRKIEFVFSPADYIAYRSQELLYRKADEGAPYIWKIGGETDNLAASIIDLMKSLDKPREDFFEKYVSNRLPFSFLVKMEGLLKALSKISTEQRGFIYATSGTIEDVSQRRKIATQVLADDCGLIIDGISAVLLAYNGKLDNLISSMSKIYTCPSVINILRDTAQKFHSKYSTSKDRIGLHNDKLQFVEIDKNREVEAREKLLKAADLLELKAIKLNGLSEKTIRDACKFHDGMPLYVAEPYILAQQNGLTLLSEDGYYQDACRYMGDSQPIKVVDSATLFEMLYTHKKISLDDFLGLFSFLSNQRVRLLYISADFIYKAIFGVTTSQIVTINVNNINKLNLDLLLSSEYGVEENVAIRIIVELFLKLIKDDSVTAELCEEIFRTIIPRVIKGRDGEKFSTLVIDACTKVVQNTPLLLSQEALRKLTLLKEAFLGNYLIISKSK